MRTRRFLGLLVATILALLHVRSDLRAQPPVVASYAFSEGTGSATGDASGNGNQGTLQNGASWSSQGFFGNALAFDGSDDHVSVLDSTTLDVSTGLTLEAWVYPTTATPYGKIIEKEGAGQRIYSLGLANGGRVIAHIATASGVTTFYGDAPIAANQWTHLAVTYDGSVLRIFHNGIEDTWYSFSGSIVSSSQPLWIGKSAWGEAFTGRLDEVRIYGAALTPAEIADDMYLPVDPSTPLTVAARTPASGSLGVITTPVAAIFTRPMNAATLTSSTFTLQGPGGAVAGGVSYDAATRKATFTPSSALASLTDYTATVIGGAGGVAAGDGSTLAANVTWTFRTAAAAVIPGAAYGLSEGNGLTTNDSSGNGNHGTLTSGPTWSTQGVFGAALVFDGSDDHVAVKDNDALDVSAAFTLEGWVYPTTATPYGKILNKEGVGQHAYALGVTNGARVTVHLATGPGTQTFLGDASIPANQWTHVAATYDGSALRLYINGIQDTWYSLSGSIVNSPKPLWLGKGPWGEPFTGRLDELRIYRRALSPAEIVDDMYRPVDDSTPLGVATHTPAAGAVGVIATPISATFTKAMNASTLTASTFTLQGPGGAVAGTVAYDAATRKATFTPTAALNAATAFTATVVGGASGVAAADGSTLPGNVSWSFRTAADAVTAGAAYGLSEGTGLTASDSSGNGNHGTLTNGPTWSTEGMFGNAVVFDGGDDSILAPDSDALDVGSAFTLEGWVYPTTATPYGKVVNKEGVGQHVYALGLSNGARVTVQMATGPGTQTYLGYATVPSHQWTHLAATYDGAILRLYVNGVQDTYYDVTGAVVASPKPLWIGKGPWGEGFTGRLDELRIYRRALSAAEIAADMNTSVSDTTAPSVAGVTPLANTRNVSLTTTLTATFNEPLDPATVNTSTFQLRDTRSVLVSGTVTYDAPTRTATFTPSAPLLPTRTYTGSLIGGASGMKDVAGNALAASYSWTFITTVERTRMAAGLFHSVAVDDAAQTWTWGSDFYGERGTDLDGRLPGAVAAAIGVTSIVAGSHHTLVLKSDGTLLAWGANWEGQLGDGSQTSQTTPVAVSTLTNVIAIAAGYNHSVGLKSDGTVWTWGAGPQIGDGANTRRLTPVQVTALTDVIAIAAHTNHSLALKADGTVWAWGENASGQLGDGTTTSPRLMPVQVSGLSGVVGIAAGDAHSLAIVGSDLSLRSWGSNYAAALGDPTVSSRTTPGPVVTLLDVRSVAAGLGRSGATLLDGTSQTWGRRATSTGGTSLTPVSTPGAPPSWQLALGQEHASTVSIDGIVSAWSANPQGFGAGDGTYAARPLAVPLSAPAYAWKVSTPAFNPSGTGTLYAEQNVSVTALTAGATVRYTTDGTDPTESSTPVPGNGIVVVDRSLTLKAKAWKTGQPPSNIDGTSYTLEVPAVTFAPAAGTYTADQSVTLSCAVSGVTIRYTLDGSDPTPASAAYATPIAVTATTTIKARAYRNGWTDSAVAAATYTLKVAALSFSPDAGSYTGATAVTMSTTTAGATIRYTLDGSEPTTTSTTYQNPVTVANTTTLRAIAWKTGWSPSDTKVASYRISLGTTATPIFDPTPGTYASATIVRLSSATPGAVIRFTTDGSEPTSRSPRYLWPQLVATTTTFKAKAFTGDYSASATATATYALDAPTAVATPTVQPAGGEYTTQQTVTISVATSGATIRYTTNGVDPTETDATVASGGTIVVPRSLPLKVKAFKAGLTASAIRRADYAMTGAVAASTVSSYALKTDGTVWAWGANSLGQVGDGTTQTRMTPVAVIGVSDVVAIAAGGSHALALKRDGTVYAWGLNQTGQLGLGDTTTRYTATQITTIGSVVAIAAGDSHSLALKSDGTVWAWGANFEGEIGDGTLTRRYEPVPVTGLSGVTQIAAAGIFSMALQDDGAGAGLVWAWGQNNRGQLGDGTVVSRLAPVRVGALPAAVGIGAGPETAYAIASDGRLWAWGRNDEGQVGDGTRYTDGVGAGRRLPVQVPVLAWPAEGVAGGSLFTVAVTRDGLPWAWGTNVYSQLGDGTSASRSFPDRVATLTSALRLAVGSGHALAVKADGTVWAWGSNTSYGLLGDGTDVTPPAPIQVPNFSLGDNAWLVSDPDADGVPTWRELRLGSDPLVADTNADGLADGVSESVGLGAANPDFDADGVSNVVEGLSGTDPFNADTDGDGVTDGVDAFPLDPSRSQPPPAVPGDTTPPVITLIYPANATPVPPE